MIIDAHTHIGKLLNSPFAAGFKKNLDLLLSEAKKNKVGRLLIIAGFERADGWTVSTRSLLKLVGDKPNVSVVGSVDILCYGNGELAELRKWLEKKLVVAIKLYTGYEHFYPSDRRCLPIYKLCLKYGVPVIFHSGDTLAGYVKSPKIQYSHPIHIDEVAADFPDLKIVIAHVGNPWLIDCAEVLYKNPNVYADISGLVAGEDLATPYGKLMKKRIKELIAYVGQNHKLLYGTDWPLCSMNSYIKFAHGLGLSKEQSDQLFYKNAAKLFNLRV